jgi:hypothetical protein
MTYKLSITNNNKIPIISFKDRIDEFKETEKYLRKLNKYNCLVSVKKKNNFYEYNLENGVIILEKRIGSKSRYGVIYLTTTKFNNKLFATKLTEMTDYNYNEIIISTKLSKIALKNLSPHFLFVYKSFYCINDNTDKNIPISIKNTNYYICVNELINGNFKQFIDLKLSNEYLLNALQQILLSILSFHYFTNGIYHGDCHYKNFLFIKINSGGYFHYKLFGKSFYIKNMGYLWFIWDFGLIRDEEYYKIQRIKDYFRIMEFFDISIISSLNQKIINIADKIISYKYNYPLYFGNSDKKFFEECVFKNNVLLTIKDLPKSFKTINTKPYIINDF